MRKRKQSISRKEIYRTAFGLALGMIGLGCIAIVPMEEAPSLAPPRTGSVSALQEPPPGPSGPGTVAQESSPAPAKFVSVRQEAGPTPTIRAEPDPKKGSYFHTVKWSGETMSIIADWYTGDQQNWKALAQANPQINPDLIYEGDRILVPEHLLKIREPFPKEFINHFYSKSRKAWPKAENTQAPEEEPKLFGPRK